MSVNPQNPLIVQSDRTLLLDVHAPLAGEARVAIMPFAELEKSPEHIHTFRITALSLWNAAGAGFSPDDIVTILERWTRYPIPPGITEGFRDTMARYGKLKMIQEPREGPARPGADAQGEAQSGTLLLTTGDPAIRAEIAAAKGLEKYLQKTETGFRLSLVNRGTVKRELIALGWPVADEAPLINGEPLEMNLREREAGEKPFVLRDYQREAARAVAGDGRPGTGFGVVVLP